MSIFIESYIGLIPSSPCSRRSRCRHSRRTGGTDRWERSFRGGGVFQFWAELSEITSNPCPRASPPQAGLSACKAPLGFVSVSSPTSRSRFSSSLARRGFRVPNCSVSSLNSSARQTSAFDSGSDRSASPRRTVLPAPRQTPKPSLSSTAIRKIAFRLCSTSSSVVAQQETLRRLAAPPCQRAPPHQQVPSS